jgi:hypothetical protein
MNQDYVDTVRLLLAVAPVVFRPPRFALKGGTALNLFVQDMRNRCLAGVLISGEDRAGRSAAGCPRSIASTDAA